ncbi:hypothetical protein [Clostridium sp.]|uniref:tetratricopeptide repeat protein n=1 Tax=Clostridium sp. TaxID=1506 RepID=UPI001A53536C|nr:hypothetical protein [Clostridium sp.]MBK5241698.1 hypothetical protein [Clostridium sp.]
MNNTDLGRALQEYKGRMINLQEFFKRLPDEKERLFEVYIVYVILETESIEDKLLEILKEYQDSSNIFYTAFYCLCTYYRRRKDTSKYGETLEQYKYVFYENPTYSYLKAMFLMQRGREEDIKEAIVLSRKSIKDVPHNVGIIHCFTEIIAEAFEDGVLEVKSNLVELEQATQLLQDVLKETSDYAKFYCTYGRLLALSGEYKKAKQEILFAIDKENSSRTDYSIRIGEYQRYLIQITSKNYADKSFLEFENYRKKMEDFNKDIRESMVKSEKEVQGKIQDSLNKNLEFLGFFTALISFIIASVQILIKSNFQDAFLLILELGGMIMLVLSSFGIILNGNRYIKRSIVIFIMGITCIVLAFCIHILIY